MPQVLNIQGFWIYQESEYPLGSEYTRVWGMPLVLNMQGFWIYGGSEYASVRQGSGYAWICLKNFWIYLIMTKYVWICLNMLEYAGIYLLDDFCVTFPLCNPLSTWMRGYLSQNLHETISCSLKEHEVVFLTRQNLIFYLVAGSINLIFVLDLIFLQIKSQICCYLWVSRRPGALNRDIPKIKRWTTIKHWNQINRCDSQTLPRISS